MSMAAKKVTEKPTVEAICKNCKYVSEWNGRTYCRVPLPPQVRLMDMRPFVDPSYTCAFYKE